LLLRSAIAAVLEAAVQKKLVRWRTEIHDRFVLPWFVQQDLEDVIEDLNVAGYPMEMRWVRPARRVRFPRTTGRSSSAACRWNCGRRSSRGTCSAKSRRREGLAIRRLVAGAVAGAGECMSTRGT